MAIYHLNMHSVHCGFGASAIAHAAYISASKLVSDRTGEVSDYSKKNDVKHSELLFPDGVEPISRENLWNQIEAAVKIEGRNYGKTGDFALPIEWTDEQCIQIAKEFLIENFVKRGHAVDFAFHKKDGNPHIDYFVPQLRYEQGELTPPPIKSVFANTKDENGKFIYDPTLPTYNRQDPSTYEYRFAMIDKETGEQAIRIRKNGSKELKWHRVNIEDDSLNSRDFLLQIRQSWQDIANQHLEPEQHIDCRSLKAQGIEREPQIHLSPTVIAMEKKNPGSSKKVQRNNEIKERNSLLASLEKEYKEIQAKITAIYNETIASVKKCVQKGFYDFTEPSKNPTDEVKAWTPDQAIKSPKKPFFLKNQKKKSKDMSIKER